MSHDEIDSIIRRLDRIERLLVDQRTVKEWYSTDEVAELLDRSPYSVREWARLGRVRASKRACGRGRAKEWAISHEELTRLRNEGLLPDARVQRKS